MKARLLIMFSILLVFACNKSKEEGPIQIGGTYMTTYTYWELEYYSQDSAEFVKYEVQEAIEIEKQGDGIYIPKFNQYFIVEPFQPTPIIPEDEYRFIPEDQTGATIDKRIAIFYEFGDSLFLSQFYDYTPYPLDRRFTWVGRKI